MCNVSRGTVDRVLHGRPNVEPSIRQAVLAAIERTGYQTPRERRSPVRSLTLGILVPTQGMPQLASHCLHGVAAAEKELNDPSFRIESRCTDTRSADGCLRTLEALLTEGSDGLLVNLPMFPEVIGRVNEIIAGGTPVFTYFNALPQCAAAAHIGHDGVRAGRVAAGLAEKYLHRGDHALAVVTDLAFHAERARAMAFRRHLETLTAGRDIRAEVLITGDARVYADERILGAVAADPRVRLLYAANSLLSPCLPAVNRYRAERGMLCIASGASAAAREALSEGSVDFVIGPSLAATTLLAVKTAHRLLTHPTASIQTPVHTELSILTRQTLGGSR